MDEPIGFWVRQIATDGAVIAVRTVPGQETARATVGTAASASGRSGEERSKASTEAEAA
jgi:hypothetical protein